VNFHHLAAREKRFGATHTEYSYEKKSAQVTKKIDYFYKKIAICRTIRSDQIVKT
jgi:hypothetical protein